MLFVYLLYLVVLVCFLDVFGEQVIVHLLFGTYCQCLQFLMAGIGNSIQE